MLDGPSTILSRLLNNPQYNGSTEGWHAVAHSCSTRKRAALSHITEAHLIVIVVKIDKLY